ncbi:Hypothetical protein CINCED_3A006359 [Cinara cedri]|uniref:Uncharacterized protein n=1 Tax=Cinara cedri TaxID=506608 RepID=A0A5E4MXD9_9HEMI|nr:Hypothetical protein CINCED_3A006359 [Cinara cedri]
MLGLVLAGCEKFCCLMDLAKVANRFLSATKEEKAATAEEKKTEDADELTVSSDGTWKKRGFSSLVGVTLLIGYFTGKNGMKLIWMVEIQANHTGNMGVKVIKTMFQRSVGNGVQYRNYIGDSKVYSRLEKRSKESLSGKGKLLAKLIDKLTVYYGLAIRRHSDSVKSIKNAIWAMFFRYSSTDKNPQHKNA